MEKNMAWKEKDIMVLRYEFVSKAQESNANISRLCREYGISRQIAYKWLQRYKEDGILGLENRSKRPSRMPSRLEDSTIQLVLSAREEFPEWGAKKIVQSLANRGHEKLPSIATANRILKRYDKITPAESEKRKPWIRFEREEPNELWQMDFKGFFALDEGNCHPLTILDDCSRYSICLKACLSEDEVSVRRALEEAFHNYGLPIAMTMDNGSPWKGYPKQRLSSLTVWLMRMGIKVGHSRPCHPQTQGKLERFHQSFKKEVLKYHNFQDIVEAQNNFNAWQYLYNYVRPHEALNLKCPGDKYKRSSREYTTKLEPIEYLVGDEVKKVGQNGEVSFKGKRYYIGGHLRGENIAFRPRKNDEWDIYYVNTRISGVTKNV
jgi:transposase InsO family protein